MGVIVVAGVAVISIGILGAVGWALYFDRREFSLWFPWGGRIELPTLSPTEKQEQKAKIIAISSARGDAPGGPSNPAKLAGNF